MVVPSVCLSLLYACPFCIAAPSFCTTAPPDLLSLLNGCPFLTLSPGPSRFLDGSLQFHSPAPLEP